MKRSFIVILLLIQTQFATSQWKIIANMKDARAAFTATQIGRKIYLVGGRNTSGVIPNCEAFDLNSQAFSPISDMHEPRHNTAAVMLQDSTLYVPSGLSNVTDLMTATCEIYNPKTNIWTYTTSLQEAREAESAVLLPNGTVLIVAGALAPNGPYRSTCEIFDPKTKLVTFTGSISSGQFGDMAFFDGSYKSPILISDHFNGAGGTWLDETEEYDISTNTWEVTAHSASPHGSWHQQAVQLPSGEILAPSGGSAPNTSTPLIEIYNPTAKAWRTIGTVGIPRVVAASAYIGGDSVLLVGGFDFVTGKALNDCEIINTKTGEVTKGPSLNESRYFHRLVTTREKDAENPCIEIFKVYVFGGETKVGSSRSSCEMIEFRRGAEGTLAMPDSLLLSASVCVGGIDTTLSITNGACFPIVIDSVKLFALGKGSLSFSAPSVLASGKSAPYQISFAGTKADSTGGVIRVYYTVNGVQSSKSIPVTAILRGSTNTLTLPTTLSFASTVCDGVDTTFTITSNSCIGLQIDSARVEGLPYSFVSSSFPVTLKATELQSLGFSLHSSDAGITSGKIRIYFTADGIVHDTTIVVVANLRASVRGSIRAIINDIINAGDTVEVPLYLSSNSGETIDGFDLSLRYNTDLLTPLTPKFSGTLVDGASLYDQTVQSWGSTLYVPFPFTISSGKPLVILRFKTYVTTTDCTVLRLDRLRLAPDDPKFQNCLLAVANDSATICRTLGCGDRIMQSFLKTGTPKILSAQYDARENSVMIRHHSFGDGDAAVTVCDAMGRMILDEKVTLEGNSFHIDGKYFRDGIYFLTMRSAGHEAMGRMIVVQ